ncbi:MAG: chromosomal replication initiator protein DnaA [Phycisphaeraceae bacterium]|nr:chromosomal replication initiator protein DnaA [Phycisphaeraceae bacterium]
MTDPDRQVWDGMLAHLRVQHPEVCRQWFEELEPVGIAGGQFQLRALTVFHRDYLRERCTEAFNDALRSVTGALINVRFIGPEDPLLQSPGRRPKGENGAAAAARASGGAAGNDPDRHEIGGAGGAEARGSVGGTGIGGTHEAAGLSGHAPGGPLNGPLNGHVNGHMNGQAEAHGAGRVEFKPGMGGTRREDWHSRSAAGESRRHDSVLVNPDYSFENFIVGPGNRLAHAAAQAIATNPGRVYNPFFVHGGVGLGKTHLLQALCLRIAENYPGSVFYYTSCEGFVTQYIESVQRGQMSEFRHRFRDVDVLVIDDIHFLASRESSQEEFFHTFNALFNTQKQLILSSDAPPEEIPDLEERLVSRFKWGLVTKIDAPTYETRITIVKSKAKVRGLAMPDDVACYIAAKIDTNIRELEGAVVKLHIKSAVDCRDIDIAMARETLETDSPPPSGETTLQAIIGVVTEFYGVRLADLQSRGRQRSIALPRQVCMYLARRCTRHSLEEVGGFFGGRDHTTVMHAVDTIEKRRKAEGEFDALVRSFEERLRAPRVV